MRVGRLSEARMVSEAEGEDDEGKSVMMAALGAGLNKAGEPSGA